MHTSSYLSLIRLFLLLSVLFPFFLLLFTWSIHMDHEGLLKGRTTCCQKSGTFSFFFFSFVFFFLTPFCNLFLSQLKLSLPLPTPIYPLPPNTLNKPSPPPTSCWARGYPRAPPAAFCSEMLQGTPEHQPGPPSGQSLHVQRDLGMVARDTSENAGS